MVKINFERVKIYTGVAHKEFFITNIKESFADVIYKHGSGIKAHALAFKIFNSNGETDYSDEEVRLIRFASENYCTPNCMDAIMDLLDSGKESNDNE